MLKAIESEILINVRKPTVLLERHGEHQKNATSKDSLALLLYYVKRRKKRSIFTQKKWMQNFIHEIQLVQLLKIDFRHR